MIGKRKEGVPSRETIYQMLKQRSEDLQVKSCLEVRTEWMTLMGCSLDEIAKSPMPTDLQYELEQLAAAKRLNGVKP